MMVTKIAYKIINKLSDINLPIEVGDYKLISKKVLNEILKQNEFRPYVRGLSIWVGFKQTFVKYERILVELVFQKCLSCQLDL